MLTYLLNMQDDVPLYEQLYKLIKADIAAGHLRANEKLPSRRSFAANLGVSTMTVENAYAQLSAEGYIYTLPKRAILSVISGYLNLPPGRGPCLLLQPGSGHRRKLQFPPPMQTKCRLPA